MINLLRIKNRWVSILCATALVVAANFAVGIPSQAEEFPLFNGDFEMGSPAPPNVAPGGTTYIGGIPGWNVVNAGGVFEPDFVSEISYPTTSNCSLNQLYGIRKNFSDEWKVVSVARGDYCSFRNTSTLFVRLVCSFACYLPAIPGRRVVCVIINSNRAQARSTCRRQSSCLTLIRSSLS